LIEFSRELVLRSYAELDADVALERETNVDEIMKVAGKHYERRFSKTTLRLKVETRCS
jgi:hypothetical protein